MRKSFWIMILSSLLVVALVVPAVADTNLQVVVNDQTLALDVPPAVENGRTLVPLRAIFEALGATVDWDQTTNVITANNNSHAIKLTIGQNKAFVDGQSVNLDVPSKVIKNRTLVPLRFVAEGLGAQVDYVAEKKAVYIKSAALDLVEPTPEPAQEPAPVTEPTSDPAPAPAPATTPTATPNPNPNPAPAPTPSPSPTPDVDVKTPAVTEFRVVDSLEIGKKLVVVALDTAHPETYNVYVNDVKLDYRADAKKFIGDVPAAAAIQDNVKIYPITG